MTNIGNNSRAVSQTTDYLLQVPLHAEHEAVRMARLAVLVLALTPNVLDADVEGFDRTVDQIAVCIDGGL